MSNTYEATSVIITPIDATKVKVELIGQVDVPSGPWSVPLTVAAGEQGYLFNPALVECHNGDILCFYRKGAIHGPSGGGKVYMRRSLNRGVSWGSPQIVHEISGKDCLGLMAGVDPDSGRVILKNHSVSTSSTNDMPEKNWLHTSEDNGATWTTRDITSEIGLTFPHHGFGPVIKTANGLAACYYWFNRLYLCFSSDGGLTWGNTVTIFNQNQNTATFTEAWITAIDENRLVLVVRDEKNGARYFFNKSNDGGLTWGATWGSEIYSGASIPLAAPCCFIRDGNDIVFSWNARSPFWYQYVSRVNKETFWNNPASAFGRFLINPETNYRSKIVNGNATGGEYGYITLLKIEEGILGVWYDSKTGNGSTETEILAMSF